MARLKAGLGSIDNSFHGRKTKCRQTLGCLAGVLLAAVTLSASARTKLPLQDALLNPYEAPAIAGIHDWIHADPLTLRQYRGKVVLLNFWTYSSINSLRTLPQIAAWQRQYGSKGLVVVSIHTPEFGFERDPQNVAMAVTKHHLSWPVALDNDYRTWQNFHNNYWPGMYLIDQSGYVVYQHFGEGGYHITENNIRTLLGLRGRVAKRAMPRFNQQETPETYMGYDRAERYGGERSLRPDKTVAYSLPSKWLKKDFWGLQGAWTVHHDRIVAAVPSARFRLHFNAQQVYAVMGHAGNQPAKVRIWLDGHPVKQESKNGKAGMELQIGAPDLYQALALSHRDQGVLEIEALTPGVELYTVTFG